MKPTTLILICRWISNVLMFVYLLGYSFFLFLVIDEWFLDGRTDLIDVSSGFQAGFFEADIFYKAMDQQPSPSGGLYLSEISDTMKFWLLLRSTIFTITILLLGGYVLKVLNSIGTLKTFYQENISHFTRMTILSFIAFLFSCFNLYGEESKIQVYFTIAFWPLIITLLFGILAVVFKQGNLLMEEQKLFV